MRRPGFWIALALLSAAAVFVGVRYFPQAFSIVALDITMDRGRALDQARSVAERNNLGPKDYRQAASFSGDEEAQTFVELEGGGKPAFTRMLIEALQRSESIRRIMAGLVSGQVGYHGLRRRLLRTGEMRLALEYLRARYLAT